MAEPLDFDVAAALTPSDTTPGDVIDGMTTMPQSRKSEKLLEGQAILLSGSETDPLAYQAAAMEGDKQALFAQAVQNHREQTYKNIEGMVRQTLETSPQSLQEAVQGAQEELTRVQQESEGPLSNELAVVDQVASTAPVSIAESARRKQAVRLAALNDLAQMMDKQGTWDTVSDYAGFLIPFGVFNDINDVVDDDRLDWTNATDIETLALDWHSMSAERQQEVWPEFRDVVIEAMGTDGLTNKNIVKAMTFFNQLFTPRGGRALADEQLLDLILGGVDIATLQSARSLAGAGINILKSKANLVKTTKELGDGARAAGMNINAMTDEAAGAAMGVDKQQAIRNALPMDTGFDPGRANLTEEMTTLLNDFQRRVDGTERSVTESSELVQVGAFRKEDVQYKIKSTMDMLEKKKADYFNEGIILSNIVVKEVKPGEIVATYTLKNTKAGPSGERLAKVKELEAQAEKIARKKWGDEFDFITEGDWPKKAQKLMDEARALLGDGADEVAEVVNDSQQVTEVIRMSRNDITGTFEATVEGAIPGIGEGILSPSAMSKLGKDGDFHLAFKNAESLSSISAAATSRLLDLATDAIKPKSGVIGREGLLRVEKVLVAGDEFINEDVAMRGKVFTQEELITGVPTKEGYIKLTSPAEQEVYYKYRMVMDQFARLKNHGVRQELILKGFDKEVAINGTRAVGHELADKSAAKASVRERGEVAAWDNAEYDSLILTDDLIDKMYDNGFKLVKLMDDEAVEHADGAVEYVGYTFAKADEIGELPEWVIHTKPGYVPKINQGVEYLVKESIPAFKKGVKDFAITRTSRFFASKKEAQVWREQMIEELMIKDGTVTREAAEARFAVVADREMTPLQKARESVGSSGGLYTGARATQDIKMGLAGVDVRRVAPIEAMQRNSQHLGAYVSRNEWRIGEEQRWINTLRAYAKKGGEMDPEDIKDFHSTKLPSNAFGLQMERQRELIRMWAGVPTRDEQITGALIQRLHDWALQGLNDQRRVLGLKDKESVNSLLWLKHSNPIMAAKAAVMHATLGVFNLSQIPVQASAATVAASRYPRLAPKAVPQAWRMMILDNVHDETALGALFKKLGWDKDGMEEMYSAWKRTGFKESVRNNADISVADNYGYVTMGAMKRASDASLYTYRTGELFNRRFSFSISYDNWKRNNPGKVPNNEELNQIMQDANKSMLELGHANRAWWQGGPDSGALRNTLGLATQFWQVIAKATELTVKGEARGGFSTMEKVRILLGQTALFGSAGIPIAGFWADDLAEWLGMTIDSKEDAEAINQGLLGVMLGAVFADVDVSGRIAPFGGGAKLVKDILFDDIPLAEKALGVFGSVGSRGLQAVAQLRPLLLKGLSPEHELNRADYLAALQAIGSIPSSGRNLFKAIMMHNSHMILDRHGNMVTNPQDFTLTTEIMAALGFRPNEELRTRIIQMDNKDYDSVVTEASDVIMTMWHNYLMFNRDDPAAAVALEKTIGVIFDTINNEHLANRIRENIQRKIGNPKSIQERELNRLLERTLPDEIESGMRLDMQSTWTELGSSKAVVLPFANTENE